MITVSLFSEKSLAVWAYLQCTTTACVHRYNTTTTVRFSALSGVTGLISPFLWTNLSSFNSCIPWTTFQAQAQQTEKKKFCFSSWPFGWHSLSVRFRDLSYAWWYVLQRCSYHMHIRSLHRRKAAKLDSILLQKWMTTIWRSRKLGMEYQVLYPSSLITSLEITLLTCFVKVSTG